MNHVFLIDIKYQNGEIGYTKIIINTDNVHQYKIWRWALIEAYELAEREKAELIQVIRLS